MTLIANENARNFRRRYLNLARLPVRVCVAFSRFLEKAGRKELACSWNLRQYSLDVEEVEMKVNPLIRLTIEEVVAFRVTRVQAGVIWRRERTVPGLVAVENKGTRVLPLLPTCRYTEV